MCFDRMDWYYEKALEKYFEVQGSCELLLTDEEETEVARRAANHIGLFLTWVIRRNLEGELHREEFPKALEEVRTGALPGVDFFLRECDGKFWDEDVSPELLPFVEEYYGGGQYWTDYVGWVLDELGDLPLEFVAGWEDYLKLEPLLDRAYEAFRGARS